MFSVSSKRGRGLNLLKKKTFFERTMEKGVKAKGRVQVRNFFSFLSRPKEPKLSLHKEIALQGWKWKDMLVIGLIGGLSIYSFVTGSMENTEDKLEAILAKLKTGNEEEIIKTLSDFCVKTVGAQDNGGLYVKHGMVEQCFLLLSHSDLKVRKEAWRTLSDLESLHSCKPIIKERLPFIVATFSVELKRWMKAHNKMKDYFELSFIVNYFCSIVDDSKVDPKFFTMLAKTPKDVHASAMFLQIINTLSANEENAYAMREELSSFLEMEEDKFTGPVLKTLVRRILKAVYVKEGSLSSIESLHNIDLEAAKQFALLTEKELSSSDIKSFKKYLPENKLVGGMLLAASVAAPWSFLRASFRLIPKRTFSEAFPLIMDAMGRAVIGATIFSAVDELAQNRRFYHPHSVNELRFAHALESLGQMFSIVLVWRYTPYGLFPALLAGIGTERYVPMVKRISESTFEAIMSERKKQFEKDSKAEMEKSREFALKSIEKRKKFKGTNEEEGEGN